MATRTQILIPIVIAAVIIGIAGVMSIPSDSKLESVEFPRGTVKIDDVPLEVQVADTEPRRVRGLMFQDQLPYNQGMIFVFDKSGIYSLWMLNMQFPLDMIWFDQDGNIIHIEKCPPKFFKWFFDTIPVLHITLCFQICQCLCYSGYFFLIISSTNLK